MKAYKGYSSTAGPGEAAILIFASNVKEARTVGFESLIGLEICEDWIDCRVIWIKEADHLFYMANQTQLQMGIAHVVNDPDVCETCGWWGGIKMEGGCSLCTEEGIDGRSAKENRRT